MPDRLPRGLLDTSVVNDLDHIPADALPIQVEVSAVTMAELAAGPSAAIDDTERARRQDRLQRAEAAFDPLPVDTEPLARTAASMPPLEHTAATRDAGSLIYSSLRWRWRTRCPW